MPQIVHLIAGPQGGMKWLPMYLPVLVAGCLLGPVWGLSVGILSPIVSFIITYAFGNPMPILARLPYMIIELAVFAGVSGLFSKKIVDNKWWAFLAVLLSAIAGRVVFLLITLAFESVGGLSFAIVWTQVKSGLLGLLVQWAIVPVIIIGLKKLMERE